MASGILKVVEAAEAEIANFETTIRSEQDILRFDVTVHKFFTKSNKQKLVANKNLPKYFVNMKYSFLLS